MSFILDALTRAQALRGRKTAALAHAAWLPPARVRRRRNLWLLGAALALLGAGALAAALWTWQRPPSPPPEPVWVSMPEADEPASRAASSPIPALSAPTRPGQPTQQTRPAQQTFQAAAARFRPPTTLTQPLPLPGSLATGSATVPPPPPAMVAVTPPPAPVVAVSPRVVPDDLKPLTDLPRDVQAKIWRMKVTLHVYTPQPSTRYVMIDNRQFREGDDLFDGVRLDEITETGVVLRHERTRVLALAPAGR